MPSARPETRYAKGGDLNIELMWDEQRTDLVAGSGIHFEDRGEHELKGVGSWRLYSVV